MTANLAIFLCEEGWVLLRFVLIFLVAISSGMVAVGELGKERICMKISVLRGC